jgi:hypothetical protein
LNLAIDFLSLLVGAAAIFLARDPGGFRWAAIAGIVFAGLCWWGCYYYTRLFNTRYRVKLIHQALCASAALITLMFAVLYPALAYVGDAADLSIKVWEATLSVDVPWAATTFREAYTAVRRLGIEDFSGIPEPGAANSFIPTSHDESRQRAASVYASAACDHFAVSRPFLSKVVWARPGIPTEAVFEDVRRWHASNPNYPPVRAIALAGEQIRSRLAIQTPHLVSMLRLLAVALFLLAQAVPFGLIGWAAYRDIKVKS